MLPHLRQADSADRLVPRVEGVASTLALLLQPSAMFVQQTRRTGARLGSWRPLSRSRTTRPIPRCVLMPCDIDGFGEQQIPDALGRRHKGPAVVGDEHRQEALAAEPFRRQADLPQGPDARDTVRQPADLDHGSGCPATQRGSSLMTARARGIFQRHPFQLRVLLGRAGVEAHLGRLAAIRPLHAPGLPALDGRAAPGRQAGRDRALQPELRRMVAPLAGVVRLQRVRCRRASRCSCCASATLSRTWLITASHSLLDGCRVLQARARTARRRSAPPPPSPSRRMPCRRRTPRR